MKKNSFFKSGSGSRKAFVSSFQNKQELKEKHQENNVSLKKPIQSNIFGIIFNHFASLVVFFLKRERK